MKGVYKLSVLTHPHGFQKITNIMRKISLFLISLLVVFFVAACSDGLDDVEYNGNNDVAIAIPQVTATTSTSLTVISSVTGNLNNGVKIGFCYSINGRCREVERF